jgi:hypothetical protein
MPGAQYQDAKKALEDIQERHQDIIKIEKSILVSIKFGFCTALALILNLSLG